MNTPHTNILLSWSGVWGIVFLITSCSLWNGYPDAVQSALEQAGPNRRELVKVLTYYAQDPADSLKLRAAEFLIGNMPGHRYQKRPDIFDAVFDSAARYSNRGKRRKVFARGLKRVKKQHPPAFRRDSTLEDLRQVTAFFLIRNIRLAFQAYHKLPSPYRPDFEAFCRYVLPYRAGLEPLEFDKRAQRFARYQWVYGRLKAGKPLGRVINSVIDSMGIGANLQHGYPGLLSGHQMDQVKFGDCDDKVNYAVNTFRAIGLPVSFQYTPHWGNHPRLGHSWLGVHGPDSLIALTVFDKKRVNHMYRKRNMPKIYQRTYAHEAVFPAFTDDITAAFRSVDTARVPHRWDAGLHRGPTYLMVFDLARGWVPVARAQPVAGGRSVFPDMGRHIAYLPGYYGPSHSLHPLNYPFIIKGNNQLAFLNPDSDSQVDSATILRKYPPFFLRTIKHKVRWMRQLNGLTLQGSNTASFHPHRELLTIRHFHSTHVRTIPLSYKGKYRYYRIQKSNTQKPVFLATLRVISDRDYVRTHARNRSWTFKMNHLTDRDPLSLRGGKGFVVQYDYDRPVKLNALQVQARNDDNHIDEGDRYRLLQWDQGWQPMGTKVARDTMLIYHNLPQNALYWLRDLTEGHEEEVFTLTANGRQWWPGVSNYAGSAGNSD